MFQSLLHFQIFDNSGEFTPKLGGEGVILYSRAVFYISNLCWMNYPAHFLAFDQSIFDNLCAIIHSAVLPKFKFGNYSNLSIIKRGILH